MPDPLSSSAATGTVTTLALLSTVPGVDPAVVLGAFAGAVVFAATHDELGQWRRLALFVASFIGGLLLADLACQLLDILLPAAIQISQAVGALLASAVMVRLLQAIVRAEGSLLNLLFKRGEP